MKKDEIKPKISLLDEITQGVTLRKVQKAGSVKPPEQTMFGDLADYMARRVEAMNGYENEDIQPDW